MKHEDAQPLDALEERRIAYLVAAETCTDLRSVRKALRGEPVRGVVGERIRAAIARHRAA